MIVIYKIVHYQDYIQSWLETIKLNYQIGSKTAQQYFQVRHLILQSSDNYLS